MEIFTIGSFEGKKPSKWETAIYVAIQSNYITKSTAVKNSEENIETSEIDTQ